MLTIKEEVAVPGNDLEVDSTTSGYWYCVEEVESEDDYISHEEDVRMREAIMFDGDDDNTTETETETWPAPNQVGSTQVYSHDSSQVVHSQPSGGFTTTERIEKILRFEDFYKPQSHVDWLVERLIAPGDVSIFYGMTGSKKTWLMYDLAVSVATGQPWAGIFPTRTVKSLIIDEENGRRRVCARFARILKGHNTDQSTVNDTLAVTTMLGINLGNGDMRHLEEFIKLNHIELVIIDSQAAVTNGLDENSVQGMRTFYDGLKHIAESTQAAIICLHHTTKDGVIRGSQSITDTADQVFKVKSKNNTDRITITAEKLRDGGDLTINLKAHFEDKEKFSLSSIAVLHKEEDTEAEIEPENSDDKLTSAENQAVQFVRDNGASTTNSITAGAHVSRQLIDGLRKKGVLQKVGKEGRQHILSLA
jgi:hypothetical protein